MADNQVQEDNPSLLNALRHNLAFNERRRFILLFLVINLLIFVLIWLSWQNQMLVRKVSVLETQLVIVPQTRVVEAVTTCEVDCTDKMVTMAARQGEKIAQVTATIGALITRFPTPGTPTGTPAWTETPSPTFTPIPTPMPPTPTASPTWTPAPPTPTHTLTPKPKPRATPTRTPSPTTPPTPVVLGITPTMTARSTVEPSFPVTITGERFASDVTARLGEDFWITDIASSGGTTITGKLSPAMPVGVYGLTVTNIDAPGSPGILSPAFIVYDSCGITIPLESPYLVTFGKDADPPYDGEYQVQWIFFEVPTNSLRLDDRLHIRIFDADTGGKEEESFVDDDQGDGYETFMRYTLYTDAYTQTRVIGADDDRDQEWYTLFGPLRPNEGRQMGDRYIFELAVEGLDGNDANWYRVALSKSPSTNTMRSDVRIFAFSWVFLVRAEERPHLHPYVTREMKSLELHSFGSENLATGKLAIRTPLRQLEAWCSADGMFTPADFPVEDDEGGATWTVDFSGYDVISGNTDYLGFSAKNESGSSLPIFIRPTILTPTLTISVPSGECVR